MFISQFKLNCYIFYIGSFIYALTGICSGIMFIKILIIWNSGSKEFNCKTELKGGTFDENILAGFFF